MIRPVTTNPSVTAGLRWPPEMYPTAETMTANARPVASAIATSEKPAARAAFGPLCCRNGPKTTAEIVTDPAPAKTSVKVPTNSERPRR